MTTTSSKSRGWRGLMKKLDKKDIEDILLLTPMQEGMLFHYLKDPGNDQYFEQLSLSIQGKIEIQYFEKAWNLVARANEILRVLFQWERVGNPVQIILKKHKLKPGYYDFSGMDDNETQKRLEVLKTEDRKKKFDLRQVPFRVTLCKIKNRKYEMIISNHHILYDGWSTGIILEEFVKIYDDLSNGSKLKPVKTAPQVKTKYKEFVKWIQKNEKQHKKNREEFWKNYLNGFDTPTRLSIKTKPTETGEVKNYQVKFDMDLTGKLKEFVNKNKTTLAALLYSAWGVLLQKYNNSDDVIFGTTVSGRSAKVKGIERMVGLFINTLPLRFNLPAGTGVLKAIAEVDRELQEREAYESTPLVDIKTPGKIDGREELFDTVVVIENYPLENILTQEKGNENLSIRSYSIFERTNYDLTLGITISAEIKIDFIYTERCFDKDTIVRLSRHFANVTRAVAAAAGPGETLSGIVVMSAEEKEQILYEFNGKEPGYPIDRSLCRLFAAQVEKTPDHIAALGVQHRPGHGQPAPAKDNMHFTYKELNQYSHQLVHLLVGKGAGPGTLVALEMERSIEMIAAILGVLMAGCGYVPLDPKAPRSRNKYIQDECNIGILLTAGKFQVKAEVEERFIETIDISQCLSSPLSTLTSTSNCQVSSANLAYVIFTSGSTGKPKGVPITHSNLSPLLHWGYRHLGLNSRDHTLQNLSYYFDWSVWEIFITLTSGAGLVIMPEEVLLNPGLCIEAMREYDITVLHITPTQYQTIANQATASDQRLDNLKYLCIGAEKLTHDLVARSYGLVQEDCRIFNMYGPTEATIMAAVLEIDPLKDEMYRQLSGIPIGIPIANSPLLVLDRDLNLCPVQVKGELYIAGDGLSRGYLNDPEKTAAVFIKNRFHQVNGCSLYKTGDVVRWLWDGSIEYMGRIDTQVKVRGFRIETGEIENRLLAHQWIKDTIVIAKKDLQGETYLAAYVVLADGPGKETDGWVGDLISYLSRFLPGYMIPAYFVSLERMPLTPNGKINLEALPQPQITPGVSYSPPRNTRERTLVNIWAEILRIDSQKIGIDHDFFQLGGHSLKTTTLMSRIHQQLKFKIPLADLFILPTVREQAAYMNDMEESLYSAIPPVEEREYYDLSFAQRRLWIICQFEEDSTTYNMVGSFDISGPFKVNAFERTIRTLVDRHDSFRTTFINVEGHPKQKILKNYKYKQEVEDLRHLSGPGKEKKIKEIMERDANKSFDLENGPLFLFDLMRLEDEKFILLVNIHHLINDGWSLGIINNELLTLYNAYSREREHFLPLLQLQYKDYTLWHNRLVGEKYFDRYGEYWLGKFKDKPNGMELPIDHPRGAVQTFRGGRVYFTVDREQNAQLHRLCPGEDASIFMKLLSLLNILLYHYTGQSDIPIGAPIFNRKKPELHHMIGFLVNTLVVRNELNPDESFRQLLRKIKKETMDSYENQDYPFDVLVERLEMDRDLSRSPLFNFMLAFDNTDITNPGLTMAGVDFKRNFLVHYFTPSVFDLVFIMDETHGQLNGEIMYNRDLFERSSIERMKENFFTLTASVLENQDTPIHELNYISPKEYETIIDTFNSTRVPFPQVSIREAFEKQVEKSPYSTAVVYNNEVISYGELNSRANQLAHYLVDDFHVRSGDIIGISMDRSIELIVVILGIVKAGAGYVAIDPNFPEDRVLHMLTDSGAGLVIIDRWRPELFGNYTGQTINPGLDRSGIPGKPGKNPGIDANPGDIIYVIYTSGSTGTPNGAMLSQGILANLVQWQMQVTSIDASLRCLQFTSINFCVSFQEIFITLISGGEVHLIDDIQRRDIHYLMEFLAVHQIGLLYLPFSYLNHLFNESSRLGHSWKHYLKHIVTAGEQLKVTSALKEFLTLNPEVKLHNHYGSSEMHVVTSYTLDASSADIYPVPPAGAPIANTAIYILDDRFNPVPVGVWGELCVAGSWEVAGYINNRELTDKKLFNHPFLPKGPGRRRLYLSGDIGRWLPDGNIELRGRKDSQVKVRGYRVELSEVETKILGIAGVKECAAVVKGIEGRSTGEKYLAAYVVVENIELEKIKALLANYLPQYMIPQLVKLDALPLTPTGKVDHERLPDPHILSLLDTALPGSTPGWTVRSLVDLCTGKLADQFPGKNPHVSAMDKDVLPPDHWHRLSKEEYPDVDYSPGKTIQQRFEAQVARTPDNIALVGMEHETWGKGLTYKELNQRSNQLAYVLKEKGIKPDTTAAIMMETSVATIIAILGILKAGGAYLPVPPDMPRQQLLALLEENRVLLLITHTRAIGNYSFTDLQQLRTGRVRLQHTPDRPAVANLDNLPLPNRSLVNYEKYMRYIGITMVKKCITILSSRGCPYNCAYCHKIWPKKQVCRSAENIFQEIKLYYDMGVRRFAFIDDIFNLNVKNSSRLFQLVLKSGLKPRFFFSGGLRGDILTPGFIDMMVEAGTVNIAAALETASPRLQKLIGKNLDVEKLRKNLEYICKNYPQVILELHTMHGFPTETEEEALMTLDFIKGLHWLDFPYIHMMKIYRNTDMEKLALENGVLPGAIEASETIAFHQLQETLPFDKSFTLNYQADFLNGYFLSKTRLKQRLPRQMKVLTEDDMVQKYNSYLPVQVKKLEDLLEFAGIDAGELETRDCFDEKSLEVPGFNDKLKQAFPAAVPVPGAFRVLLLDLSQFFSTDTEEEMLYDVVEAPLGLVYLLTYLNRQFAGKINGKIFKARVDFDSYEELKALILEFNPRVIGVRALTFHKSFFHKTIAVIRHWLKDVPVIVGGPYASSDYETILQDRNIDLVVRGEGEITFGQLIDNMMRSNGKLPEETILKQIPGIVFPVKSDMAQNQGARDILLLDQLTDRLAQEPVDNPPHSNQPDHLAYIGKEARFQHREANIFLANLRHRFSQNTGIPTGVPLAASYLADAALDQVFPALCQGSPLYILPPGLLAGSIASLEYYPVEKVNPDNANQLDFHLRLVCKDDGILPGKYIEPMDEVEEKLADIWCEVLEIEKSGVTLDSNFFELGGHSLKATNLMAGIHRDFKVKVKLIEIFQTPTLREIAAFIKQESSREGETLNPAELKSHYPLSPAQKRLYMVQHIEAHTTNYNMFDTLELSGKLDKEKFADTFRQLIQRHESFRTSFITVEEVPVQRIHHNVEFEIEYNDISEVEGEVKVKVEEIIGRFNRSFDLSQAPLLRVGLIKLAPDRHILLVDMNHIISDGTSIGIFIRDFMALYRGKRLKTLPIQYKDFAQWQNSNQYRESIKNQEQYWKNQYQGEIPRLNLPLDYPRPAIQSFAGDFVLFELDAGTTSQLNRLALEEEATLYMVILALYTILLSKLTRQQDIIIGTPTAGRKYAPLQNLIGMFVNTLTMRNFPVTTKTFEEFLKEVKIRTLHAFTNQDYPFEDLVDHAAPHRDSSRNPIFDVMFALQNMEIPGAEIPGLKLKPYPQQRHTCPFDMILDTEEKDGKLRFKFRFCTALFKKDKIERFIHYFKEIIHCVIKNKTIPLADIKISHQLKEKQLIIPQQVREGFNFN
jgi:amino acid adenylation domain-containing protein